MTSTMKVSFLGGGGRPWRQSHTGAQSPDPEAATLNRYFAIAVPHFKASVMEGLDNHDFPAFFVCNSLSGTLGVLLANKPNTSIPFPLWILGSYASSFTIRERLLILLAALQGLGETSVTRVALALTARWSWARDKNRE